MKEVLWVIARIINFRCLNRFLFSFLHRGEGIGLEATITEKWKCPETITIN